MSSAQVDKPRICWGVGRGGRLVCGDEVKDPRVIEETMRLINEFMSRVERHRGVLLSDSVTPFDYAVNALSNWLSGIAVGNGDDAIAMLRNAEHEVGRKMLGLLSQAREGWLRTYKPELEELIEKLRKGEARIIISGDPFNRNKSFMAHLYTENLAINVARVAKSGTITINISLTGLEGVNVVVPKPLSDEKLRASQYGLLMTDGAIDMRGYPTMGTNQLWQSVAFALVFPGKTHIYINGISINNDNVSIIWILRAMNYRGKFGNKAKIAEETGWLSNDEFPVFLLFAVLGDGYIDIEYVSIGLTMGDSKRKTWSNIIERLMSLGFREKNKKHAVEYVVKSSKAANLAKKMLSDPIIKALVEDLAQLPDSEKLRRLIELTSMETKPLGRSSIEVAGIKMNVCIYHNGGVELRVQRMDYEDAVRVWESLKNTGYKEVKLSRRGKRYVVYMDVNAIMKYPELTNKACEIIRRMLEETLSRGRENRAKAIAKAMARLGCQDPAQDPRASNHLLTSFLTFIRSSGAATSYCCSIDFNFIVI
ncbi:MAG: hypothetical protein ACP5L5_01630 [Vulcanisaeta sp.]|uniref:hypothetical protein n=1 Tax=Vulcanisaeta sp. TaxID=2020871 RepID=UPI003D0CCB45